ncbi:MAG: phosphatidylglycerophosphatase A [Marinovum algicola]|jgi:phosphatidylglycerophosphatase A|uniref:Phosphatidylglycerophosphatase A n=1 Tax=Marinovum algicola TaxID=42444 RepID=A0A975ZM31_9RHOB|nr:MULTISPECIES: phosphatidylglycerophosphatase A [Marinovum]MDD9739101.1 phosphatidylglycerophosphatase A [Marinovum sp. SP66]MDD9744118.1 phosphatidylglycerophosphatase A [Marinovum sp. PR37]SEI79210.1 phosphatidylglycerophosphatase A [Marinovum algicola]SLN17638.1 Phosphatidylglycerophosphatase A [Marinovum algicola]
MSRLIATWFYSGYLKPAPGTWGSLAALPFAYVLHLLGGPWLLLLATLAIFALGYWATGRETAGKADHDPSEIVVDEVVGQWLALWPVSYGAVFAGADVLRLWPGILAAFLFFRLFDIWKPGPVGWADRKGGPMGVMLDDVFAGIAAGGVVIVLAALAHLVLLT